MKTLMALVILSVSLSAAAKCNKAAQTNGILLGSKTAVASTDKVVSGTPVLKNGTK